MNRLNKRAVRDTLGSYVFLVPWLIGFFLLTLYPMCYSLYLSFTRFNIRTPPQWIGMANYLVMFKIGRASCRERV